MKADESDDEYIRKDLFDKTIELAEDHAYFAGQENFREKVLDWAKDMKHLYELPITTSGRISKECLAKANAFQQMIDKLKTL